MREGYQEKEVRTSDVKYDPESGGVWIGDLFLMPAAVVEKAARELASARKNAEEDDEG